ncbi:MAG: apolipoprotein N-acyltransferase [bacterium]
MNVNSKLKRRSLLILSGVLLGLSFPPFGLLGGFCAFFALVPLLIALEDTVRLRNAFTRAYLAMFVLTLIATYWVGGSNAGGHVDPFLMIAGITLDFLHPLFLLLPILLYDATRRRFGNLAGLVAFPIIWLGFEFWHSNGDFSFPWLSLYNTQTYNLYFIQFIDITGSFGISLLVLFVNMLLYLLLRFERVTGKPLSAFAQAIGFRKYLKIQFLSAIALLFILPYLYGLIKLGATDTYARKITITIIQPNINPWDKWSLGTNQVTDSMFHASKTALAKTSIHSDLLLWPETAITYPITLPWKSGDLNSVFHFISEIGVPILTGIPDREEYQKGRDVIPKDAKMMKDSLSFHRDWNSAMLFSFNLDGKPSYQRYHKQKLVPFGERVPFVDDIPILGDLIGWSVGIGSWNTGEGYDYFKLPFKGSLVTAPDTARICTMICYESVYPSFVREFTNRGAELITIVTNDGWYGKSSGPIQHSQFAVLRAVENRRWVVRSANTGISSVIDDKGRFIRETNCMESASVTQSVPLLSERTIYARLGDFIAIPCEWGSCVLLLGLVAMRIVQRKKK